MGLQSTSFYCFSYFCALSRYERHSTEDIQRGSNQPCHMLKNGAENYQSLLTSLCAFPWAHLSACLSTPLSTCPQPSYQFPFTFKPSGDEDFARFLNHGLWLSSSSRTVTGQTSPGPAGEGVGWLVRLRVYGHLDGVGPMGLSIVLGWQQLAWNDTGALVCEHSVEAQERLLTAVYFWWCSGWGEGS